MHARSSRTLQFTLVAALGALCMAGLAELLWSFVPVSVQEEQVDCQETVMVLSLDKSFSMVENDSPSLQMIREAVQSFVTEANKDICLQQKQFGLVTFNQEASLDIPPGSDLSQFNRVLDELDPQLGDRTIIEQGVSKAVEALNSVPFADLKVLFLLTDTETEASGSNEAEFRAALEQAVASNIDVYAVITNEGPHAEILRGVLGNNRVQKTDEAGLGESFIEKAKEEVLKNPVIGGKPLPPLFTYLFTSLWTSFVTAGIALSLLLFLNRYNKRSRWLSGREALTVLLSLVLGFAVGAVTQYVFSLGTLPDMLSTEGSFFRKYAINFLIWPLIGLLLAASLAGFRILPNLKLLNTLLFGLLGGLIAGLLYSSALELLPNLSSTYLPRLIGAAALGAAIGLVLALLSETSTQFPIWLRVFYTSDKVYRYHPVGSTPLTVGAGRNADVYVHSDLDKLWQFWVEDSKVYVKNFYSDKTRAINFRDVLKLGAIELEGMIIKIVGDKDHEKGQV